MKRLALLICLLPASLALFSQIYAYSCNGKVQIMRNGEWQDVFSTMELQLTDQLQTEEYGCVTVLDRTNSKLYSIQSLEANPLGFLIKNAQQKTPKLMAEYVQGIWNKLFGFEDKETEGLKTTGGVTYRGENETRDVAIGLLTQRRSYYPISCTLIDHTTNQPVEYVREGQTIIVQINNLSDTPLYVNIVDIDADGNQSALFPFDEKQTMLNLYIPALSNVRLQQYPIAFAPAGSADRLKVVAYPMPFDLNAVLEYLQSPDIHQNTTTANKIGIFQLHVSIL